jgi:type III secretion system (T3SS) inner membrane Yop/YscD-like protein
MRAGCPHCGHVQTTSEELFGDKEILEITCAACGQPFMVTVPRIDDFKAETTRHSLENVTSEIADDGARLRLPEGKTISVKVLEGEDKGTIYPVVKPRVTLGRSNSDIIVNDPLSSRIHCAIEFSEDCVLLRDLGSTNGTLVDDRPVHMAEIADGSTFQIGKHKFQLRIASAEK